MVDCIKEFEKITTYNYSIVLVLHTYFWVTFTKSFSKLDRLIIKNIFAVAAKRSNLQQSVSKFEASLKD
jgi:hypothetical protein